MTNKIEQAILSSMLWSYQLPKDEESKINSITLDINLFKNSFHKAIVSIINEFRMKSYIADEITVSDSLIKRSMMNPSEWFAITIQTAGGYNFITNYLKMLKAESKMSVFDV
jgi:hypothetical protein